MLISIFDYNVFVYILQNTIDRNCDKNAWLWNFNDNRTYSLKSTQRARSNWLTCSSRAQLESHWTQLQILTAAAAVAAAAAAATAAGTPETLKACSPTVCCSPVLTTGTQCRPQWRHPQAKSPASKQVCRSSGGDKQRQRRHPAEHKKKLLGGKRSTEKSIEISSDCVFPCAIVCPPPQPCMCVCVCDRDVRTRRARQPKRSRTKAERFAHSCSNRGAGGLNARLALSLAF